MRADSSPGGDVTPAGAPSVVEYFARGVETPQSLQTPAARADTPTILSGMPLPPPSTPSNPSHLAAPSNPAAPGLAAAKDAARWPDVGAASRRAERGGMSGALAALALVVAALALVVAAVGVLGGMRALSALVGNDAAPTVTVPVPAPGASVPGATTSAASPSPQPGSRSTAAPPPHTTPSATVTVGPTPVDTPSPAPTGTPVASAVPLPTGTPIPPDGQPVLSVEHQPFIFVLCNSLTPKQSSFTVSNGGGGTLNWAATTADGYTFTPSGGTLAAGQSDSVTITNITKSGHFIVTAPGATGSPQSFTITCQSGL